MATHDDLNLLKEWREPLTTRRVGRAALGSLCLHIALISAFLLAPETAGVRQTASLPPPHVVVPLYFPVELTQHDENKGKITKTLDVRSRPAPASVPQAPRFRAPTPIATPALPAPVIVEAPKIEAEAPPPPPPPPSSGRLPEQAPPPPDKPKLAFENVGAGGPQAGISINRNPSPKVPDPRVAAENALRASVQPGQSSAGIMVGDLEEMSVAPSVNQASVPGPVRSNLQLLSDPKGIDFKPYLIQVLSAVRTNWLAVIPESARLGRKGRVLVQFIIDKRGGIPKLVIAESSGAAALDRAAVAGISASNPLPPLPSGFQGNEIRLQLAFSYNQPTR
jgi:TonB family protein